MAAPPDKLALSLEALKTLQDYGLTAIHTTKITRTHRERLLKNGFIKEVFKGWYISSRPDEPTGESTAWYASFWGFCADYLHSRFDESWCLCPEQSLSIHTGNWSVPKQLLVRSPQGGNKPISLLHETSIFDVRLALPDQQDLTTIDGIQILSLPAALVTCSPRHFTAHPIETRAALAMISNASDILHRLLRGDHSKVAGRLAGAFRNIGRDSIADNIVQTMKSAGYAVSENDPFHDKPPIPLSTREVSPYVNRLRMSWAAMRATVINHFPSPPSQKIDAQSYLKHVDDLYVTDAYHSLFIEGYQVSAELIERVRSGDWNPDTDSATSPDIDRNHKDALAARGYWQAFQAVKESVIQVLGDNQEGAAGKVAEKDYEKCAIFFGESAKKSSEELGTTLYHFFKNCLK